MHDLGRMPHDVPRLVRRLLKLGPAERDAALAALELDEQASVLAAMSKADREACLSAMDMESRGAAKAAMARNLAFSDLTLALTLTLNLNLIGWPGTGHLRSITRGRRRP